MTPKPLILVCATVLLVGCAHVKKNKPIKIRTDQNSPMRMHIYDWPEKPGKDAPRYVERILLLPPLGIEDPGARRRFHEQLYSGAQRRFTTPIKLVQPGSAYAPYIDDSNLMRNDGSLDVGEVAFIGALMNCTHVICPYVRDLKPYHPQRIDISLMVVNSGTGKVCAEFSGVFDARESDVFDYFMQYIKAHKSKKESKDDLGFKIKSPAAFQGFVADMCGTIMADRLSL